MSKTAWIIFASVIVLVLGGLVVYSRVTNPPIDLGSIDTNAVIAASDQNGQIGDQTYGNKDSKVILVEYGDFQCPSCGGAHPQVKEVVEEYKDDVLFVFRNFPLTTIHPNARAAAAVVEAAGLQGKYWEMHNLVFETQSEWTSLTGDERTAKFKEYAGELALDLDRFTTDIAGNTVNKKISFDQAVGKKVNVSATPTFMLNGEKIDETSANAIVQGDSDALRKLFDAALGK